MSSLPPELDPFGQTVRLTSARIGHRELRIGDRVVLEPRRRADIMDLALRGRAAVVTAIEQDFEDEIHLAVVLEDDPGRDLGESRQPGHRFFFRLSEVKPL